MEDLKQSPLGFVWIRTLSEDAAEQDLPKYGLRGLLAHYTIIRLNDDKEIIKNEEIDE